MPSIAASNDAAGLNFDPAILGHPQVIKGWDRGVEGMRIGDKRRLIIPPAMAYGTSGAGKAIPPNAWLDFEVELVNVK